MAQLKTRNGFSWSLIAWGKPEGPRRPLCSYCFAKIDDEDGPLMLFKQDGSAAQFCDECVERYFGG
jgi:hypothetical protein